MKRLRPSLPGGNNAKKTGIKGIRPSLPGGGGGAANRRKSLPNRTDAAGQMPVPVATRETPIRSKMSSVRVTTNRIVDEEHRGTGRRTSAQSRSKRKTEHFGETVHVDHAWLDEDDVGGRRGSYVDKYRKNGEGGPIIHSSVLGPPSDRSRVEARCRSRAGSQSQNPEEESTSNVIRFVAACGLAFLLAVFLIFYRIREEIPEPVTHEFNWNYVSFLVVPITMIVIARLMYAYIEWEKLRVDRERKRAIILNLCKMTALLVFVSIPFWFKLYHKLVVKDVQEMEQNYHVGPKLLVFFFVGLLGIMAAKVTNKIIKHGFPKYRNRDRTAM